LTTAEQGILGLRNNTSYNGLANRAQINVQQLTYALGGAAGADATIRLRLNPNTNSASFVNLSSVASCAAIDTAATLSSDGGFYSAGVEWLSFIVAANVDGQIDLTPFDLRLAPGDVLEVTGRVSSGNAPSTVSLSWVEDF
jgi:hypothetical protein